MKKIAAYLSVIIICCGVSAQNPIYDSARVYDVVTDADSFYLFSTPKPCFNPCTYEWAPAGRIVQEYVTADTVTVYGVAIPLKNKTSTPIRDNIDFYRALLMKKLGPHPQNVHGYSFQTVDSVTLNRSHPRFCWFTYEDPCGDYKNYTVPCYEFYFDTPTQINRMTDTFYVGRYYCPPYIGYSEYSLREYGGEHSDTWTGSIYQSPTSLDMFFQCIGYENERWGVAFPIIGFRCGPIQQFLLDSYTGDSAVVRWHSVEEGSLFNVRLVGEDGSDTTFVTADTTFTFSSLLDSVRYTAMLRKQCHYATSNYDTTVYGTWRSLSFGAPPDDDTVGIVQPKGLKLALVPNPTSGEVLLTSGADLTGIAVYTASGVPFLHLRAGGRTVRIDTSTWPAGTYLLQAITVAGTVTRRLTVVH